MGDVPGTGRLGSIAAAALLAAACGSAGPSGAGTGDLPTGPPTTLPFVREAPADFTERAEHIASTLRTSGALDRYAEGLVLTSERVTWPEFGAAENLKLVLGNGAYETGPAVTDQPGSGEVRLDDGRSIEVDLLGARATLAETRKGLPGCVGPDSPCPLVMTSARLGTVRVSTNQGSAQVPAWEYSAQGFVTPMVVVAVDPTALAGLPEPVYDEPSWGPLLGVDSLTSVEGTEVKAVLLFGACERDHAAHVFETDDVVVIGGRSTPTGGVCTGIGYTASATIVLAQPLGKRPVVDVAWGRILVPTGS